jgi:hypothetical protein
MKYVMCTHRIIETHEDLRQVTNKLFEVSATTAVLYRRPRVFIRTFSRKCMQINAVRMFSCSRVAAYILRFLGFKFSTKASVLYCWSFSVKLGHIEWMYRSEASKAASV